MLEDVVVDRQGEVEADQFRGLDGAQYWQPHPEPELDHLVHHVRVGDAVLHDGDRLPPQGVLQPVPHETGDVPLHAHGVLAQTGAEQGDCRLHGLRRCPRTRDDFHQGDQGRQGFGIFWMLAAATKCFAR